MREWRLGVGFNCSFQTLGANPASCRPRNIPDIRFNILFFNIVLIFPDNTASFTKIAEYKNIPLWSSSYV